MNIIKRQNLLTDINVYNIWERYRFFAYLNTVYENISLAGGPTMSDVFEKAKQEYVAMSEAFKKELLDGYNLFKEKYGPENLKALQGEELLNKIFTGQ